MLHAAATSAGLFIFAYVLLRPLLGGAELAAAAGIALAGTLFALRFGGPPRAFTRALAGSARVLAGTGRNLRGALSVIRAAAAADIALRPVLMRISAPGPDSMRERLALAIGSAPGAVVVDSDSEGMLVHVNNEDGHEAAEIEKVERELSRAAAGGVA